MSTAKSGFGQSRAAAVAFSFVLAWAIGCMVVPAAAADPIAIGTIEDLQKIGNEAGFPVDGHYILTNDIDASGTANWNDGAGFEPIGESSINPSVQFTGSFDGQGFVVSGLHINRPDDAWMGLFGVVGNGGEVRNVGLDGGSVTGNFLVGGLVGLNLGTVTHSYATGAVEGLGFIGGLVGENGGTVTQSYATGAVEGLSFIGGLVGENGGTVTQSYATGAVSGDAFVGGLVGQMSSSGTVTQCYATGTVSGNSIAGGLVGRIDRDGTVTNSYAAGAVSGEEAVGGLVGSMSSIGTVTQSYAVGAVSGDVHVGGLVGRSRGGSVNASFWDVDTSGASASAGGTGQSTIEMRQQARFDPPWDFDDVWDITEGRSYPVLRNTPESPPPGFGQGHVIRGLHSNRPDENRVGLFGDVGDGGEVTQSHAQARSRAAAMSSAWWEGTTWRCGDAVLCGIHDFVHRIRPRGFSRSDS